jgi:magnesium-protoporphyrin O-methyltransferase
MSDCCSGFRAVAGRQFDGKVARQDLERYRTKGPNPTTRLLREGVLGAGGGESLLDVGAGIGALSVELLNAGIGWAVAVDASPAYVATARAHAEARGLGERLRVVEGDFTAVEGIGEPADVVTMDRVVCCYPEFRPLLERALLNGRRLFAYSYPLDRWYVRIAVALENLARAAARNPFRAVVHSAREMDACIADQGFQRVSRAKTLAWCVDVYARAADARG